MKCTWWRRLDLFLFPPGFCAWRSHKKQDSFIELTLEKECSLWEYSAFTNALPLISWCWVLSIISINAFFSWPQIRTFVCPKHFEQIKICQIVLIILRLVTQSVAILHPMRPSWEKSLAERDDVIGLTWMMIPYNISFNRTFGVVPRS